MEKLFLGELSLSLIVDIATENEKFSDRVFDFPFLITTMITNAVSYTHLTLPTN